MQREVRRHALTGATKVFAADNVSNVSDSVLWQTDVGIHLNRRGIRSPVKHEILRRVRICVTHISCKVTQVFHTPFLFEKDRLF